jgi:hypothetical protein
MSFPTPAKRLSYSHIFRRVIDLSKALVGQPVGFRPTATDGLWDIVFAADLVTQVDLRDQIVQS